MAKAAAELDRAEDVAGGPQSPNGVPSDAGASEYADMVAAIARYQRIAKPDAVRCRVLFYSPAVDGFDRSGVAVPLLAVGSTNAGRVVAFLSKLSAGEWAKGRVIAAELDMEPDGGQFRKIMGDLVRSETLESGSLGYRLKRR